MTDPKCPACETGDAPVGLGKMTVCTGRTGCVRAVVRSERTTEPADGVDWSAAGRYLERNEAALVDLMAKVDDLMVDGAVSHGPGGGEKQAPPTGGADVVERLRDGLIGDAWGETDIDASWGLMTEAADEIARLRAEVETKDALLKADEAVIADLRAEVEKVGNEAMDHLDTLGDIHQEMDEYGLPMGGEVTATDVGRFVGHIRAEFPALAQRVAEKVREAMRMRASGVVLHSVSRHPLTAQREMRAEIVEEMAAMDLRPIVAAAIKEGE